MKYNANALVFAYYVVLKNVKRIKKIQITLFSSSLSLRVYHA